MRHRILSLPLALGSAACAASAPPPKTAPAVKTARCAPARPTQKLKRALRAARAGDLDLAITCAQAASTQDPGLEDAFLLWASACAEKGSDCETEAYRAGVARHPQSAPLHNGLGLALLRAGDQKTALTHLRQAADGDADPRHLADLAYGTLVTGDAERATEHALAAVEKAPDCAECQMVLGQVWLTRKKPRRALPHYLKAAELTPGDPNPTLKAAACWRVAQQPQKALAIYRTLEADHGGLPLTLLIADTLVEMKQPQKAHSLLSQAVQTHGEHPALQKRLKSLDSDRPR